MSKNLFYKFYDFKNVDGKNYTKEGIDGNYLWASHPSRFNDPYDCAIHNVSEEFSQIGQEQHKQHKVFLGNKAIICFCEENDNMLMWSHYADFHKGFCVGYNLDSIGQLLNKDVKIKRFQNVSYTNSINIDWEALQDSSNEAYWCELSKLLTTKSVDWSYEKEWRIILEYEKFIDKTDNNGRILKLCLDGIVEEIIFGAKCDQETKLYMHEKFPKATFKQASLHPKKFMLTISKITD